MANNDYAFRHKSGRAYHAFADNPYSFPADEQEKLRLDSLHEMARILYHKNVLAPIENLPGTKIVDLGTGRWAIEVAEEYPHAVVQGVDLAPIQPTDVPKNCSFQVGDINRDLGEQMFPDGSIDLVHMRLATAQETLCKADASGRQVHAGVKGEEWPSIIGNLYRMLKSGGWIQVGETSDLRTSAEPPSSSVLWQFSQYFRQIQELKGAPRMTVEWQRRLVENAGFTDIQVFKKWFDFGNYTQDPDSKRAGALARYAHGPVYPIIAMGFTQIESEDERRAIGEKALAALASGKEPVAGCLHQIIARKPPVKL